MVDKVDMYYSKATVAIIPLLSGSGTRLKLLEAMAHRVPVVSTSVGAEGISWEDGKSILIANDAKLFAKKVSNLLNNSYLAESISASALALTKSKYDWNIIGRKMASYLKELK
jgi:glycosyltransferase involved in cell wall biosynthesis